MTRSGTNWKRASGDLRAQVLESTHTRPRWEGKTDSEITFDSAFWKHFGDMLTEVQAGQTALKITD